MRYQFSKWLYLKPLKKTREKDILYLKNDKQTILINWADIIKKAITRMKIYNQVGGMI